MKIKKRCVLLGAGGHAKVIIDIIHTSAEIELIGILSPAYNSCNKYFYGIPILGGDDRLPRLFSDGIRYAFIGVGSVGDNSKRYHLYSLLKKYGFYLINAIHPSAIIARSVIIKDGTAIMPNAVINAETVVGENVIINTGVIIEHDCVIGSHTHVASGACLSGNVVLGESVHVGTGARIIQGIRVGDRAIIGAGAVVIRDVLPETVVAGVPASALARS